MELVRAKIDEPLSVFVVFMYDFNVFDLFVLTVCIICVNTEYIKNIEIQSYTVR